jgi:hypothetical protein
MPWTLSHPAIVLPLRRFSPQPLDFAALVIGSMTPDIGFYIDRFDLSTFAHTLPGSFLACLPTGVILLFFYYLFCRPVCYALPSPHRQALLPLCPDFPTELNAGGLSCSHSCSVPGLIIFGMPSLMNTDGLSIASRGCNSRSCKSARPRSACFCFCRNSAPSWVSRLSSLPTGFGCDASR